MRAKASGPDYNEWAICTPVVNTHKRLVVMDTLASLKLKEIYTVVALEFAETSKLMRNVTRRSP